RTPAINRLPRARPSPGRRPGGFRPARGLGPSLGLFQEARWRLEQIVELPGYGIVPGSGAEYVQPAVGAGLEEPVANGRVGAALQEQAVDDLRAVAVDSVLQRGDAPRSAAGVGAAAEQQAHILHPVGRPATTSTRPA